jgi:hypothetical protein
MLHSDVIRTRIMVVPYSVEGATFRPEKPRLWADARLRLQPS